VTSPPAATQESTSPQPAPTAAVSPKPKPKKPAAAKPVAETTVPVSGVVQLPTIPVTVPSVTAAPPSRPTNQASSDAVVVSPTTTATPSEQSPSSVTVITANDIATQQRLTVPDALATVPGLNVVQTGGPGGQTSVFIRGTNSNHVKVIIDGIEMSDPSNPNESFDFGQLLTGDIERIEVLRGPQSGLYGADALGGVIVITTKSGNGPPKLTMSAEGGSFGTTNERTSLSGSQAGVSYAFNIQHFQSTSTPVTPSYDLFTGEKRNNDFYDNWTYSTKLGANVSDTLAVNVVARYTESKLKFTNDDFVDFFPTSFAEPFQSTQLDHQFYGRGEAVWSPVVGFKNFFGVNYSNSWTWNWDPNADTGLPSPTILPPTVSLGTRLKEDYRGEMQVAPGQLVIIGAEDQNETLQTNSSSFFDAAFNEFFFTTNAERRNDAGWLELQNQLTNHIYMVSNIRYDANEDYGDHITWRAAPVFLVPVTDTKIKGSIGTAFKAPPMEDLYVNFLPFFLANPNLKPEESTGWDAGFEQPIANDRFRFGSTYFRNDIRNLIATVTTAAPGVSTLANVNVASTFGAETFAAWQVTTTLNLRADYTYTVAKADETIGCSVGSCTGEQLLRRPKNKASLTATWQVTDRFSLSSTFLYVGSWWDIGRQAVPPSGFSPLVKAPAFNTVNFAANYALTDSLTAFGRIDNLFNYHYEDPSGFMRQGFGAYGGLRLTLGGYPSNGPVPVAAASNTLSPSPPGNPSPRGAGVM
jgi:vitamin B12 transporter